MIVPKPERLDRSELVEPSVAGAATTSAALPASALPAAAAAPAAGDPVPAAAQDSAAPGACRARRCGHGSPHGAGFGRGSWTSARRREADEIVPVWRPGSVGKAKR